MALDQYEPIDEHYTMTDFKLYEVSVEDLFGNCRPSNELTMIDYIDRGSSSQVYKARDKKNNDKIVAIKLIKFQSHEFSQDVFREINNLRQLKHDNIVSLLDIAVTDALNSVCLILEYCPHNLYQYIERYPQENIPLNQVKCIARQMFIGLEFLHRNFIIHRDIAPANILISMDKNLKISDLGSSKKFSYPLKLMSPGVGTVWYRAPEILLESEFYGPAVDLWSAGCILSELLTKKVLLPGKSDVNQIMLIVEMLGTPNAGVWPGIKNCRAFNRIIIRSEHAFENLSLKFNGLNEDVFDMLRNLFVYNPLDRASAADCIQHDWFLKAPIYAKEIDCNHLRSNIEL